MSSWRGEEAQRKVAETNKNFTHLVKVQNYRDTFAEILVVGSILQGLEGEDVYRFERWKPSSAAEERKKQEGRATGAEERRIDSAEYVDLERVGEHVEGSIARHGRLSKILG